MYRIYDYALLIMSCIASECAKYTCTVYVSSEDLYIHSVPVQLYVASRLLEYYIVHQPLWSIYEKKMHVRTLDFFRNFSIFFLKLLISKNANIHATGLHYAFHVAGSRFPEHFIHQPFWLIFENNCMSAGHTYLVLCCSG